MELYEIVKKLVGPVMPVGETNADNDRFENLKVLTDLAERILTTIDRVAMGKDCVEYSRKRAGIFADEFLTRQGIVE